MKEARCVAVVDGGMILCEDGLVLLYKDVNPPRIGMPGAAWLRTVNQRLVQDKVVRYEERGTDHRGYTVADVWADELHLNPHLAGQLRGFLGTVAAPTPQ